MTTGAREFAGWVATTADAQGWLVHSGDVGQAFPSLLCVRGSEALAILVKPAKKQPTDAQAAWLTALSAAGIATACWSPDDMSEAFKSLNGKPLPRGSVEQAHG